MVEVAKAAVWKLALIVLRRQTTDPWMNAIEGRVFVERGVDGSRPSEGTTTAPHISFSGAWPASWPTGVALQLHITEGDENHEIAQTLAATVPNPNSSSTGGEARYSTDAASTSSRRSSAMNFAPPGGLIL